MKFDFYVNEKNENVVIIDFSIINCVNRRRKKVEFWEKCQTNALKIAIKNVTDLWLAHTHT